MRHLHRVPVADVHGCHRRWCADVTWVMGTQSWQARSPRRDDTGLTSYDFPANQASSLTAPELWR